MLVAQLSPEADCIRLMNGEREIYSIPTAEGTSRAWAEAEVAHINQRLQLVDPLTDITRDVGAVFCRHMAEAMSLCDRLAHLGIMEGERHRLSRIRGMLADARGTIAAATHCSML